MSDSSDSDSDTERKKIYNPKKYKKNEEDDDKKIDNSDSDTEHKKIYNIKKSEKNKEDSDDSDSDTNHKLRRYKSDSSEGNNSEHYNSDNEIIMSGDEYEQDFMSELSKSKESDFTPPEKTIPDPENKKLIKHIEDIKQFQRKKYNSMKLKFKFETDELIPELWKIVKEYIQPDLEISQIEGAEMIDDGFIDPETFEKLPEYFKYTPFCRKWKVVTDSETITCDPKPVNEIFRELNLDRKISNIDDSMHNIFNFSTHSEWEKYDNKPNPDICNSCGFEFSGNSPIFLIAPHSFNLHMSIAHKLYHEKMIFLCYQCNNKKSRIVDLCEYDYVGDDIKILWQKQTKLDSINNLPRTDLLYIDPVDIDLKEKKVYISEFTEKFEDIYVLSKKIKFGPAMLCCLYGNLKYTHGVTDDVVYYEQTHVNWDSLVLK